MARDDYHIQQWIVIGLAQTARASAPAAPEYPLPLIEFDVQDTVVQTSAIAGSNLDAANSLSTSSSS